MFPQRYDLEDLLITKPHSLELPPHHNNPPSYKSIHRSIYYVVRTLMILPPPWDLAFNKLDLTAPARFRSKP